MQQTIGIRDEIKIAFKFDGCRKYFPEDKEPRNCYNVSVKYNGKQASFPYGDSIADTLDGNEPKPRDILEIITDDFYLTKYNYPNYEDFAGEFGYNSDSIKGLKTYDKCLEQGSKLHKLFNEKDIKSLRRELDL